MSENRLIEVELRLMNQRVKVMKIGHLVFLFRIINVYSIVELLSFTTHFDSMIGLTLIDGLGGFLILEIVVELT